MNFWKNLHPLLRREENTDEGSANGAVLHAIAGALSDAETELIPSKMQSSLNTASGSYLDYWGYWFGVLRKTNEDDDSYRYRIVQYLLLGRGTAASIIKGIKYALDDQSATITIFEPWQNIFYLDKSRMDSSYYMQGSYYRYGVITVNIDRPLDESIWLAIQAFKPAGVRIAVEYNATLSYLAEPTLLAKLDSQANSFLTLNYGNNNEDSILTLGLNAESQPYPDTNKFILDESLLNSTATLSAVDTFLLNEDNSLWLSHINSLASGASLSALRNLANTTATLTLGNDPDGCRTFNILDHILDHSGNNIDTHDNRSIEATMQYYGSSANMISETFNILDHSGNNIDTHDNRSIEATMQYYGLGANMIPETSYELTVDERATGWGNSLKYEVASGDIAIQAGKLYTVSAWVKSDTHDLGVNIAYTDAYGKQYWATDTTTDQATIAAGKSGYAYVSFKAAVTSASYTVYTTFTGRYEDKTSIGWKEVKLEQTPKRTPWLPKATDMGGLYKPSYNMLEDSLHMQSYGLTNMSLVDSGKGYSYLTSAHIISVLSHDGNNLATHDNAIITVQTEYTKTDSNLSDSGTSNSMAVDIPGSYNMMQETSYILSFDAKGTNAGDEDFNIQVTNRTGSVLDATYRYKTDNTQKIGTDYGTCQLIFTVPYTDTYTDIRISIAGQNNVGTLTIRHLKLYIGTQDHFYLQAKDELPTNLIGLAYKYTGKLGKYYSWLDSRDYIKEISPIGLGVDWNIEDYITYTENCPVTLDSSMLEGNTTKDKLAYLLSLADQHIVYEGASTGGQVYLQVGFKVYNVTNGSYTIAINTDDLYIDTDGKVCLHTYLFSDPGTRVTDVLSKYNLSLCFRLKTETVGSELEAVAEIKPITK